MGYDVGTWETFALGQLGASAALVGLVAVALSINLTKIMAFPRLVNRAAEAIILLATILTASTLVLVPGRSRGQLGVELLVLGVGVLVLVLLLQRRGGPVPAQHPNRASVLRRVLGLGAPILLAYCGLTLLLDAGGGLAVWPAAILTGYCAALLGAWVLLVEILR